MHQLIMSRSRAMRCNWVWYFGWVSEWVLTVRVAHVAAYTHRTSELIGAVEYLLALFDELCGFNAANLLFARGQPLVHTALRTRTTMRLSVQL